MDSKTNKIPGLRVNQWLKTWDKFHYDPKASQEKPDDHYYMFSMRASDLKRLTGVYRRSTKNNKARAKDPNVQRGHEAKRSENIREFVLNGYPWCEMSESKREMTDAKSLRKPGWLPTAILVNILEPGAERNNETIPDEDLIHVEEKYRNVDIFLPENYEEREWEPKKVFPMEVIDGQHRLWAFESFDPGDDFELPVVAFHGLDRSWQAYLFWSVNITPKRINRSLAYDLYPLLRKEDWLDRFAGHAIYRETRSQELVESLWSHPDSPWNSRINMLGETASQRESKVPMVSQAAWVRSLMATFVKEWVDKGKKPGGLFGAPRAVDEPYLPWNRAMQAAFLIKIGNSLKRNIEASRSKWAKNLRQKDEDDLFENDDPAFYGRYSLLTTDQGIRGFLYIMNDLCYVNANELSLDQWLWEDAESISKDTIAATDEQAVEYAIKSLDKQPVSEFIDTISQSLSSYDWRTSSTPGLTEEERRRQSVFRGSGGYKEIRIQLLQHLASLDNKASRAAEAVLSSL